MTDSARPDPSSPTGTGAGVLGSSAVMAAGTLLSRLSGFARTSLLVTALGAQLHADVFTIANTVPNMLYILLAGGVFNAVLVPQLVRAIKHDPDGGAAYTDRVISVAAVFLAGVSAVLVAGAPWLMQLYLSPSYDAPALADQRQSVIDFARYCLPQVFFYGMYVLVGQVLNAHRRFGPMMWAPIANNLVSVIVLGAYLLTFGKVPDSELGSAFSSRQELLLGLGSTLGIAVQLLVLLPYLRRAGVRFRPRFDLRGSGLGHTLRLGVWTVLFVVVNQIAYTVVVRIASGGTAAGGETGGGTGYTVYSSSFLVAMVPHSIATVSLATAMLPRLSSSAADGDLRTLGSEVGAMMRSAYALVLPVACLLPVVATDVANLVFGYGAGRGSVSLFVPTLSLFAIGLVFFTGHYLVLRGFYALEQTRRVFWVQCVISAVNIALAVLLTRAADPESTSPRLVVAYSAAYAVGSVLSFALLSRQVGGLEGWRFAGFLAKMVPLSLVGAGAAWGLRALLHTALPADAKGTALLAVLLVGAADVLVVLAASRVLRIDEVDEVLDLVRRRLPGRSTRAS